MAYRFTPTQYVVKIGGKVKYRILKLVKAPKDQNEKVYQCVSPKGATHYFKDEELQPPKES